LSPSWFIRRDCPQGHEVRQRSGATTHWSSERRVFHRHHEPVPGSAPLDSRFGVQLQRSTVRSVVHHVTRIMDIHADIRLHVVRGRLLPVRLLLEPDRHHRPLTLNDRVRPICTSNIGNIGDKLNIGESVALVCQYVIVTRRRHSVSHPTMSVAHGCESSVGG